MIQGNLPDRLQQTIADASRMAHDVDLLQARASAPADPNIFRLARIQAPVSTGYNTFNVTFLDGQYTQSAGSQTPTYNNRSAGVAHNIGGAEMSVGEIVGCVRWSQRWWFRRGVADDPPTEWTASWWGNWEPSGSQLGLGVGAGIGGTPCAWGHFANSASGPVYRVSGYMRFQAIAVPQGATISSAQLVIDGIGGTLNFDADFWAPIVFPSPKPGSATASCDISFEDADTATTSGLTNAVLDGLPRTTAKVVGYDHDLEEYNNGDTVTITGIGPLVQEVVNRPGWASGNDMNALFDEDGNSDKNDSGTNQWGVMGTANDTETAFPNAGAYRGARLEIVWS